MAKTRYLSKTKIEWCDYVFNPITGCSPASGNPGCINCYARRISRRLKRQGIYTYQHDLSGPVPHALLTPIRWPNDPARIFICSMSDLFHENIGFHYIDGLVDSMFAAPRHTFILLTKRWGRAVDYFNKRTEVPTNIWVGASMCGGKWTHRVDDMTERVSVRFISFEPLIFPLLPGWDVCLDNVQWAIVGCETGPGARPMSLDWAREIRDECRRRNISFFVKKVTPRERMLDGVLWEEYPNNVKEAI